MSKWLEFFLASMYTPIKAPHKILGFFYHFLFIIFSCVLNETKEGELQPCLVQRIWVSLISWVGLSANLRYVKYKLSIWPAWLFWDRHFVLGILTFLKLCSTVYYYSCESIALQLDLNKSSYLHLGPSSWGRSYGCGLQGGGALGEGEELQVKRSFGGRWSNGRVGRRSCGR